MCLCRFREHQLNRFPCSFKIIFCSFSFCKGQNRLTEGPLSFIVKPIQTFPHVNQLPPGDFQKIRPLRKKAGQQIRRKLFNSEPVEKKIGEGRAKDNVMPFDA